MSPTSYQTAPPRTSILSQGGVVVNVAELDKLGKRTARSHALGALLRAAGIVQRRHRRLFVFENRNDLVKVSDAQNFTHPRVQMCQGKPAAAVHHAGVQTDDKI